jgi:hypothetical protein
MLKTFALHDGALNKQVGIFRYNLASKQFSMSISKEIDPAVLPLSLEIFAGTGTYELNHQDVQMWIRGRICPAGRHNINSILDELELPEYDEFGILMHTMARCDKDELYLVSEN